MDNNTHKIKQNKVQPKTKKSKHTNKFLTNHAYAYLTHQDLKKFWTPCITYTKQQHRQTLHLLQQTENRQFSASISSPVAQQQT